MQLWQYNKKQDNGNPFVQRYQYLQSDLRLLIEWGYTKNVAQRKRQCRVWDPNERRTTDQDDYSDLLGQPDIGCHRGVHRINLFQMLCQ